MNRVLAPALTWLVDLLGALALVGVAVVLVTGGGVLTVGGLRISIHHVDELVPAVGALFALRFWRNPQQPILLVPAWTYHRLAEVASRWATAGHQTLAPLTQPRAVRLCGSVILLSLLLKLTIAWRSFGFLTGDDVEIHQLTLSRLLGFEYRAWDLRNVTYPFVFVFPLQGLAHAMGIIDPDRLVFAGRVAVILFSCLNLWLVFRIGSRELGTRAVAVLAVVLLALGKQTTVLAASVLPRTVTTTFVLLGYGALARHGARAAMAGGAFLALGASLRFSEIVFLAPAVVELIVRRRARDLLATTVAFAVTATAVLAVSDQLYWGRPFHSLIHFARYTLLEGQSSRGFEPPLHYLLGVGDWVTVPVFLLAVHAAWRRRWRGLLWIAIPLALLSALPHKESRYLLPLLPFVTLAAAWSLWDLWGRLHTRLATAPDSRGGGRALAFVALLVAIVVLDGDGYHVGRSEQAVLAARHLARQEPRDPVLLDWGWRMGSNLYLARAPQVLAWDRLDGMPVPEARALVGRPDLAWLAIRDPSLAHLGGETTLQALGWRRLEASPEEAGEEVRLFRRVRANGSGSPGS